MFTHFPHAGAEVGKPAHSPLRRTVAAVGAVALGAGITLAAPLTANADEPQEVTSSYAAAQFLSGTLLGGDLADVVALAAAEARNDGTQNKQTSKDPLNATVLQAVNVDVPGGIQADLGPVTDTGVVNQYAEAERDGKSYGASGAIGNDGGIGVGTVGTGAAGNLGLDLQKLLDGQFASTIADLTLSLKAVAASARGDNNVATGDYTLDGAVLSFSSPALADLGSKVDTALVSVDQALLDLQSDGGILELALHDVLNPVLSLIGSSADVTISIDADIRAAIKSLLQGKFSEDGVRVDLNTGAVYLDLATLHGDLNNLPVNTELLSDGVIDMVLANITKKVASLADQIVAAVETELNESRIDVHAGLNLLTTPDDCKVPIVDGLLGDTGLGNVVDGVTGTVGGIIDGVTGGTGGVGGIVDGITGGVGGIVDGVTGGTGGVGDVVDGVTGGTGGVGGIVDGLVGGLLGGGGGGGLLGGNGILGGSVMRIPVATGVGGVLCSLAGPVLGDLATTLSVDVEGTVDQILAGKADVAKANVSILGGAVPASVNVNGILTELRTAIFDGLFDQDGAIQSLISALDLSLVKPATDGLLGVDGVGIALTDILSVRVNLQELHQASAMGTAVANSGSMFTQTAVRVSALGGNVATLSVAAATVGPSITQVIDPGCTVDCDPGTTDPDPDPDPSCTVNCGSTPTATDRLALTGMGIATLIAIILALLAAGAVLAREGYRNTHPRSDS